MTVSIAQPYLTPEVLSAVKECLACLTMSTVISTTVYGITILQAYMYFREDVHHSTPVRSFVAFLFIFDSISMGLTVCGFYQYVVTDFGDPSSFLVTPSIFAIENGVGVLIATLTQLFLAQRLWAFSKQNIALVSGITILALCSFGTGIRGCVHLLMDNGIYSFGSLENRIIIGLAAGTSMVCDLAIVAALCYYLRSKRTGFKRTDSMISRLIIYAVNRGVFTVLCQAGEVVTFVTLPGRFIFIPFALLAPRLYCNTLLATLNGQKPPKGDENNVVELGTQILRNINTSTVGRENNHNGMPEQLEGASESTPTVVLDISSANGKSMDVQ